MEKLRQQQEQERQRIQRQREEALAKLAAIEKERRSTEERKLLKEKYRVLVIKLSEQDALLEDFLNAERLDLLQTQQCPNCHVQIEKNGGCLHMHCFQCDTDFTWNYFEEPHNSKKVSFLTNETDLDSTKEEFNEIADTGLIKIFQKERKKCFLLFRLVEVSSSETNREEDTTISINNRTFLGSAILKRVKECPSTICRKVNIKVNQDNWIVCNACMKQFCFRCGRAINGVQHFDDGCQRYTPI